MSETVKRGYVPTDKTEFSEKSLIKLKEAQKDVFMLINRGYPIKSVSTFVGNHYLLSERQRLAIVRATSPEEDIKNRLDKLKNNVEGETVFIDGLNLIITLETILSQSTFLKCMDGTIRDLAGLRGTYRLIDKTDIAIKMVAEKFTEMKIKKAVFYLDSPVSNTGRLKQRILEIMENYPFEVEVELVSNADVVLETKENVITTDAIILNKCQSWINLVANMLDTTASIDLGYNI